MPSSPIRSTLRERQFATNQLLIGGNHLASALLDWLGPDQSKFPDYHTPPEEAREAFTDVSLYDAWVCWRAIMLFRDVVRPTEERNGKGRETLPAGNTKGPFAVKSVAKSGT